MSQTANAITPNATQSDPINGGLRWQARGYVITDEAREVFFRDVAPLIDEQSATVLSMVNNGIMLRKSSDVMLSWKLQRDGLLRRKYEGMDADDMLPMQNLDELELTELGEQRLALATPKIATIPLGASVMCSNGRVSKITKQITAAAIQVGDCIKFLYRGRIYLYDPNPMPWYCEMA